jgi:hypothetical protein
LRRSQADANVGRVNDSPVFALVGLAVIGLLAPRLPHLRLRPLARLDPALAGAALVLLGLVLGPGIDLLTRPTLRVLAPVTAVALAWIGAAFGARFEWRVVRRIPRDAWILAGLSAAGAFGAVALGAWLLGRAIPGLAAVWAPRAPVILALAAVAATAGPSAAAHLARAAGLARHRDRALVRTATLETAIGALGLSLPLALHRQHQPLGNPVLGWLLWIGLTVAIGGGVAVLMHALLRREAGRAGREDLGFMLLAALLFGAGLAYAVDVSPFLMGAVAAAVIASLPVERRTLKQCLAAWEEPITAAFLVVLGALLVLPSLWILLAAPLLAAFRAGGKWASVRFGRGVLGNAGVGPDVGLATLAQGSTALALTLTFFLSYANQDSAGAVLATVVLGAAATLLAAPRAMAIALRSAAAPLTHRARLPELSPNAPAD